MYFSIVCVSETYFYDQVRFWGHSNPHLFLLVCRVRHGVDHTPSIGWKLGRDRSNRLIQLCETAEMWHDSWRVHWQTADTHLRDKMYFIPYTDLLWKYFTDTMQLLLNKKHGDNYGRVTVKKKKCQKHKVKSITQQKEISLKLANISKHLQPWAM